MTFSRFHPVVIIAYYIASLLMATATKNPIVLVILLVATMIEHLLITSFIKTLEKGAYYILVTILIIILSVSFKHNGVTPLFFWNEQAVTHEVLFWAVMLGVLCMFLSLIYQNMTSNLPLDKMLYLCRSISPIVGIYSALFFKFIKTYKQRWQQMHTAQKSIGYYATASFFDKLSGLIKTAYECATWTFEQCFQKSDVMRTRGFHLKHKTIFHFYKWRTIDSLLLLVIIALLIIFFLFYRQIAFFYFPYTKEVTIPNIIFYTCSLLASIPIIIEGKERVKWHYYNSKM